MFCFTATYTPRRVEASLADPSAPSRQWSAATASAAPPAGGAATVCRASSAPARARRAQTRKPLPYLLSTHTTAALVSWPPGLGCRLAVHGGLVGVGTCVPPHTMWNNSHLTTQPTPIRTCTRKQPRVGQRQAPHALSKCHLLLTDRGLGGRESASANKHGSTAGMLSPCPFCDVMRVGSITLVWVKSQPCRRHYTAIVGLRAVENHAMARLGRGARMAAHGRARQPGAAARGHGGGAPRPSARAGARGPGVAAARQGVGASPRGCECDPAGQRPGQEALVIWWGLA